MTLNTDFNKDYLPIWCEQCDAQGYFFADDVLRPCLVICRRCNTYWLSVWCTKCEMGLALPRKSEERSLSWTCPDCKSEYSLPASVYDEPLTLYAADELPDATRARVSSQKKRAQTNPILLHLGIMLLITGTIAMVESLSKGEISVTRLIGWLFAGAGGMVFIAPGSYLSGRRLSGKQLAERYPQFAWVRWTFPVLQIACLALLVLSPFLVGDLFVASLSHEDARLILVAGGLWGSLAVISGFFTTFTGIYPELDRHNGYRYVCEDKAHQVGGVQAILGVLTVAIAWWTASVL